MGRVPLFDNHTEEDDLPPLELPADALHHLPVDKLEIGMYVKSLDKPWSDCKFATRAFFIRCKQDLIDVRAECEFVTVDASVTHTAKARAERAKRPVFGGPGQDSGFSW